ncbi:hypothetical protein [Halalkalicoccus jeotgali]|uniref:Uncharacterized protein n=1 Tax=Halalkalicoccus jeotgali (strain DSM 18796 / CECT 7217 / JCM 14584 / KCTC 4019 / B3) TaxID=795797 RepID=D8J9V3_HALJB|nr:hypothetical protein [Halalkalicoccus jeotgali]ADJ14475.1 hypothetical protein HacjB3_05420 [Halalkalicoccus jeotgali B3]ELY40189.1 hypothetical protein C497_03795 [Halalkalicoccus jeotgali B3]
MLDQPTRETIRRSLPEVYWVDIDHPDEGISQTAIQPQLRWHYQSFDRPEPPYESVTMSLDPTGVLEEEQTIDRERSREVFDPEGVEEGHAHGAVTKGYDVYDVLNLIVTARGNATIAGEQYTPNDRASALADAVKSFLIERWPSRPLDHFDSDGAPLDPDDPSLPAQYADEIDPEITVRPIPGRGPKDVTDQVDAAGAQYDAAVELAYADEWTEYRYLVSEAGVHPTPAIDGEEIEPYDTK